VDVEPSEAADDPIDGAASPERQFIEDIAKPAVIELATDAAGLGYDAFIGLATDVPIVRWFAGGARLAFAFRSYRFAKKIVAFYVGMSELTDEERVNFVGWLEQQGDVDRAGEVMLEVIDKFTAVRKAELLAKLLVHCARAGSTWNDIERMSEMISAAYLDDLRYFVQPPSGVIGESGDEVEHLIALGFYARPLHLFGSSVMAGAQPRHSAYGAQLYAAFTP
jgi:hypothetical protein